jgi:hypothetical protein
LRSTVAKYFLLSLLWKKTVRDSMNCKVWFQRG